MLPSSAFFSPRMWVSSMAWTRGAFQSRLVGAGAGRAGGDLVGVVADPVVVVVLAQLGPERLELVLGHAAARGGDRLVQEDRGDRAAEAVAGPARDVLVLAVDRLPPPRRGAEELVVLQQGRGGLEDRDLSALLLVGPGPGQVVVEVGEPGGVVAGGGQGLEQAVGPGPDDVLARGDVAARAARSARRRRGPWMSVSTRPLPPAQGSWIESALVGQ